MILYKSTTIYYFFTHSYFVHLLQEMAARPVPSVQKGLFQKGLQTFFRSFKAPAAEIFTEHLKTHPTHFDAWFYRGTCYNILGNKDKAIADLTTAKTVGTPCEQLVAEGNIQMTQGKPDNAIAKLREATVFYPEDPKGWHFYGVHRFFLEKEDLETVSALKKAIEIDHEVAGLDHYCLGMICYTTGQPVEAIKHLKKGKDLLPTHTNNYIVLGKILLSESEKNAELLDEAKGLLQEATVLNPTLTDASRSLVKIFLYKKDEDQATEHAARYLGSILDAQEGSSRSCTDQSASSASAQPGSRGGGNGRGGRGGRGGGGNSSSSGDEDEDEDPEQRNRPTKKPNDQEIGDTWKDIKKKRVGKAQHGDTILYKIPDKTGKGYIWVSLDTAKHGGSAFKVWNDWKSKIVFRGSYDENLKEIKNKHDSNEGREIKKSELKIL